MTSFWHTFLTKGLFLVFVGFLQHNAVAIISCPEKKVIEFGSNASIGCISDREVTDFYWYKGDAESNDIIGSLVNRKKRVSEHYLGYYDVNNFGELVIINANLNHEFHYTIATFDASGIPEEDGLTVNITVTPNHSCPVIDICPTCEECIKQVNTTGTLKCSIRQSRPKITSNWFVNSTSGIEIYRPTYTAEKDFSTDTWNTSTEIIFVAAKCNQEAVFHCVAKDDLSLLKHWHSSIKIYTENCSTDGLDIKNESSGTYTTVLAVVISVCLLVGFTACLICSIRRNRYNRKYTEDSDPGTDLEDNKSVSVNSQPSQRIPEKVRTMISQLKDIYRPYCFVQSLPFEDPVPVDDLYTGCQCEVTSSDGKTSYLSSDKILTDESLSNERQVFILGNAGYGKTMLLKQIVKLWIEKEVNHSVLLFTSLKGASTDTKLTELLKTNVFKENVVDIDILEEAINKHDCLILLDGLECISLQDKPQSESTEEDGEDCKSFISIVGEKSPKPITVGEILGNGLNNNNRTMTVWITACNREIMDKFGTNRNCRVMLTGVSEEQIKQYITNAYKYHIKSRRQNVLSLSNGKDEFSDDNANEHSNVNDGQSTNMPVSEEEKVALMKGSQQRISSSATSDDYSKECENIYMFLENYGIINNFREKPVILLLIARATIDKFATTIDNVATWNIATLTDCIIKCLISTASKKQTCQEHSDSLLTLLQDTALSLTFKNIDFRSKTSSDAADKISINQCIDMGLLQLTLVEPSDKMVADNKEGSQHQISFCNKYFQDYFVACSIVKNPEILQQLEKKESKCREEDIFGPLKFICSLQRAPLKELCDFLIKHKWFNSVIVCLHEMPDKNDEERIISKICAKKIIIRTLSSDYHKRAVLYFRQKCDNQNVKIHFMSFRCKVSSSFLEELPLSSIIELEFVRTNFTEEDFALLLNKAKNDKDTKKLSFIECQLEDLTTKYAEIRNMKQPRPTVYRKQNLNDGVYEEFDYETLEWQRGKLGKILHGAVSTK